MPFFAAHSWYPSTAQQTTSEDHAPNPAPDESGEASLALAQTVAWLSPVQIQALTKTGATTKHVLEGGWDETQASEYAELNAAKSEASAAKRAAKRLLSENEVYAIIHRLKLGLETPKELGECFECSYFLIGRIRAKQCYQEV